MRIAYIVLGHRLIGQMARMIGALQDRNDTFFVHLDRRADRKATSDLWADLVSGVGSAVDIRPVRRHACYWGNLGLVMATVEGIRSVLECGDHYDRIILISGQDYPIKPIGALKTFLESRPSVEFIESFSFVTGNRWTNFGHPYSDVSRAWLWHLHFRGRWLHVRVRRKFPMNMVPHGGSQWWCLTRACVAYILEFVESYPQFLAYYRHAFIPDEQFFQTVLANSRFASRIHGEDLTYVDSSRPQPPWPATLGSKDLPALMASHKFFARKFDQSWDSGILDALDEAIAKTDSDRTAFARAASIPDRLTPRFRGTDRASAE